MFSHKILFLVLTRIMFASGSEHMFCLPKKYIYNSFHAIRYRKSRDKFHALPPSFFPGASACESYTGSSIGGVKASYDQETRPKISKYL